jgi:hypothetical protein
LIEFPQLFVAPVMVVFVVVMAPVLLRGSTEFAFAPASLKTLALFASAISEILVLTPARLAALTGIASPIAGISSAAHAAVVFAPAMTAPILASVRKPSPAFMIKALA